MVGRERSCKMIPITPVPEPTSFDNDARQPGQSWMLKNPNAQRPYDYWSQFRANLATGFENRCGYSAMLTPDGTVDHYESFKSAPHLAYEWSNYRYAAQWLNSSKKNHQDVLDPYQVGPGWFEIQLPSLQLLTTNHIPVAFQGIVARMMKHFPIVHDERIIRQRRIWYKLYEQEKLTLDGLRDVAPLIAAAEEKRLGQIQSILAALAARSVVVNPTIQVQIRGCKDHAKLARWLTGAATASSADEMIAIS